MGLSSKQVSSDGLGWGESFNLQGNGLVEPPKRRQSQNQQSDPLPCPRCNSKNTKFCYYNNYNKSQPRHFCKACKRHWTKGGTLRNVPIGGGRKNKRLKTASTSTSTATSTSSVATGSQSHQETRNLSLTFGDQKNIFGILSQGSSSNRVNNVNSNFLGNTISSLPLFQNQMPPFTFSSSGPFEIERTPFLNCDNAPGGLSYLDDAIAIMPPTTCFVSPTWQAPMTSGGMDVPSYWNWDDVGVDPLVSSDQLNINWDDSHEIKP